MENNIFANAPAKATAVDNSLLTQKTEEVKDIIERIPTKFGFYVTLIVIFVFAALTFFGFIIRYPNIVTGNVTIAAASTPVDLIANVSGKLRLRNGVSIDSVNAGAVVAYIENTTSYDTLLMVKRIIENYDPNSNNNTTLLSILPSKISLGELTTKYYNFYSSLFLLSQFYQDKVYARQIHSLENLKEDQLREVSNSTERIAINKNALEFTKKSLIRDSILFKERVISELEYDKSKTSFLNSRVSLSNLQSGQLESEKLARQTESKIREIVVESSEKEKELRIGLLASYNDLIDNIMLWEQKYVFRAPFNGRVQLSRFWNNDQFVQSGESVFSIIPVATTPYGQVSIPSVGAGKVNVGQAAIVKLNNYPFAEYGSISAIVKDIAPISRKERTNQGDIDIYLLTIEFPTGLKTSYDREIPFQHDLKGTVEIITRDRKLVHRLFDNIRYALNK